MATTWTKSGPRIARAVQSTTETVPVDDSVGLQLEGVDAVAVVLHAPVGQTFTGAGSLLGYARRSLAAGWVKVPRASYPMDEYAGLQDAEMPPYPVPVKIGLFIWLPNAIGLTGGAQITSDYLGSYGSGASP